MNLIFQHICTQRYSNATAGFNPSKRNKFSEKKRQRRPSQVEFEKRKESGNFSERLLMMVNDD